MNVNKINIRGFVCKLSARCEQRIYSILLFEFDFEFTDVGISEIDTTINHS